MHFRAIDERPFAVPRPGVPRLLLGFAAFSLLLHGLLLIGANKSTPPSIQQPGTPHIRAVLNNGAAASHDDASAPDSDKPAQRPITAEPRETHHEIAAPAPAKRQKEITRARETLAPATAATTVREPLNTDDNRPETLPEAAVTPTDNKRTLTARQAAPATQSHTRETTARTPQASAAAQRNYLLGQLQDQLSRYLSYPLRARRRSWEGEVLLGLRLDSAGRLHDIHLLRSSGYALLDRSALKALARVGQLKLPADAPPLQPVDLRLPVIYRLSEG